jgi:hypothetical protein
MKTKTLLIAAAALAATVISSQAQVYSGVVGYVSLVTQANHYAAVENPVDLDGIDCVTNVLAGAPKGTVVQIWNGAGFTLCSRSSFGAGAWSANAATNYIPPGVGFFISTPSPYTNTFVGTVGSGTYPSTNTIALTANHYQFIGAVLPISGTVTNGADQGPDALNLGSVLPKGTVIQVWNGAGYTLGSRGSFGAGTWSTNFTISVGQAFFVNSPVSTNWTQSLQ